MYVDIYIYKELKTESNLQIVNSENFSATSPNQFDVSDTQDINVFTNDGEHSTQSLGSKN